MLVTYTTIEIEEANKSRIAADVACATIKNSRARFVNLVSPGKYVNTLDEESAYIYISRCHNHRYGLCEEKGISVSLFSLVEKATIFLPASKVWANFWVYGGKAIERRHYSVMPTIEAIHRAIAELTCKYNAAKEVGINA